MTQLELAKLNKTSSEMRCISKQENIPLQVLRDRVKEGRIVLIKSLKREIAPCAVGEGLRTKVNANIGTSEDNAHIATEIKKLRSAIRCGADTVMDLSTGGDTKKILKTILKNSNVPVGTVPIYQAAIKARKEKNSISRMEKEDIMEVFEEQASYGVDFFTVHCGVTPETLTRLKRKKRLMSIVSRGGAFLAEWMLVNKRENPLYEYFDDILKIARKYDITLSLGDGMRPGSLIDATDRPQIQELIVLGELAERARKENVQTIIEGPGHIPIDQIESNVLIQKKMCSNAPFYVLGPLVTDVAPGYDHIVGAIGGAMAAFYGADFLCYVTPSEHLRIPDESDVKNGVIASRIAAHAADIAKRVPGALDWDRDMSRSRSARDWRLQIRKSIDPAKAKSYRKSSLPRTKDVCTMCSNYCSLKTLERYF
jgi:phosphomethylpyrimidine synthase